MSTPSVPSPVDIPASCDFHETQGVRCTCTPTQRACRLLRKPLIAKCGPCGAVFVWEATEGPSLSLCRCPDCGERVSATNRNNSTSNTRIQVPAYRGDCPRCKGPLRAREEGPRGGRELACAACDFTCWLCPLEFEEA